ncbi:MAG: agmatine deiminase family protein, partial [Anaerolineae bacterium]|nr:agmatine deiminase family protein [Anaerolineae bacterium]
MARRRTDEAANKTWRMPAEWEPHAATWLAWPHARGDWPGKFSAIPWVYAEIVRHLHTGEWVHLLVNDAATQTRAERTLRQAGVDLGRVRFFRIPTDRSWTRDYGPMFVVGNDGQLSLHCWRFTGWAKYANHRRDAQVAARVARRLGLDEVTVPVQTTGSGASAVVLEGGAIDVNGCGCLLTTEECLLSEVQARNPGMGRADYEQVFARYLGIGKTLWLGRGIAGDDTHGHVDDLARFVGPRSVVCAVETNPGDANFAPLRENLERLRSMTDQQGRRLEVVELPMPDPVKFRGQRLPASYANFYIGNEKVLVPTFNDR